VDSTLPISDVARENIPGYESLRRFSPQEYDYLSYLAILNEALNQNNIVIFLELCGFSLKDEQSAEFLRTCLTESVLIPTIEEGEPTSFLTMSQEVRKYFAQTLTDVEVVERHRIAHQFYRQVFVQVLVEITADRDADREFPPMSDEAINRLILQPGGLIHFGAHFPQASDFHTWSLHRAFYWQEHLFALGKLEEAANITNSICFALARRGYAQIAKEMLARNVQKMDGLQKVIALTNLATLLREEQKHQQAMRLYRQTLWPLIRLKAGMQLAAVFSEMSNIYRDRGQLLRALAFQELSRVLRRVLKDFKGQAICNNQLSILYRSLHWYGFALKSSKSAENYWRAVADEVNLAKTLITQGNLFWAMHQPQPALRCFDESLEINTRHENIAEAASSLSGKARIFTALQDFAQAKSLLEEAIALRQRANDHRIGIEYENMGSLYQAQGNLALALGWYEKALPYLEKYLPGFVYACKHKITSIRRQLQ